MTDGRRRGLKPPDEEFEFARCWLLECYRQDGAFVGDLERFAHAHQALLDGLARSPALRIEQLADYRMAWGWLSFLESHGSSQAAAYREGLATLSAQWGLEATWCAPSLHVALLAKAFTGRTGQIASLTPFFTWEDPIALERLGATVASVPRLLLRDAEATRSVDTAIVRRGTEVVHYDPRLDVWNARLREARLILGRTRLSATQLRDLNEKRIAIETAFERAGYENRRSSRTRQSSHKIARWTFWTYLAIFPPKKTTAEILPLIGMLESDSQYVDYAIKRVLNLLELPRRRVPKRR